MTSTPRPTPPRPREPVVWGCTEHRTPAGTACQACADQGELFARRDADTSTYRRRNR
jgi:hypothetical protein